MTHELKAIIQEYIDAKAIGIPTVMATVVHLIGSSYRRPGVRMLITQTGKMTGAVSGGCVEKEVRRQAQTVFETGTPKMMTYDGRYRLGCEGILYILIEPLDLSEAFLIAFRRNLKLRKTFSINATYSLTEGSKRGLGSVITYEDHSSYAFSVTNQNQPSPADLTFSQLLKPALKLLIFGAEHDAVALTQAASFLGWEVVIMASPKDPKDSTHFPGAARIEHTTPEEFERSAIDAQTAIVLMNHNFALDLNYLIQLKNTTPIYIGLLGPKLRREKLLEAFIDYHPEVTDVFLDVIHGPAGLNIGAETAQEIAVSITTEILAVIRAKSPMLLKEKSSAIHT